MRLNVLTSLAVVLVAASCSSGVGPTNTKTVDPLRYMVSPAASAVGYDTSVVSWSVGPRPTKGEVACQGMAVVSSGALALSHTVPLRGLSLGTSYSCKVSSWEDGSPPIESSVSFQTRVEPCIDPSPPMVRIELLYTFPSDVRPQDRIVETQGYRCNTETKWSGEGAAVAAPDGTIHPSWDVVTNYQFGSSDHVVCSRRGDGYVLTGADFTLRVVGGTGEKVHLTRSTTRKPFPTLPEMTCWMFRVSGGTVYP
jgi:hypothetical protein